LQATDFARLAARAEMQEAQVEQWRLDVARTAFRLVASQILADEEKSWARSSEKQTIIVCAASASKASSGEK
jgi:hypothetical protein